MHTRPALYQGSYSPVPYRYFKVRLLAYYPIFPWPPSPLCCCCEEVCWNLIASFLISQPDSAWMESKGSFMSLKEELVLEPGRRHTREHGLLQNSVHVFSTETHVWSGTLLTARRGEASDVNHSTWVGLQLGQNLGAPFPSCWSLCTQKTTAPL